jgi:hypothetical protein
LFLIETKLKNAKLQFLRTKLDFEGMFTVDPVGRSGGLAFFWKDSREVEIINYSLRHIGVKIRLIGTDFQWKFIGFYGRPDRALRTEAWQLLAHISSNTPQDWLCTGDFNEIVCSSEKLGGAIRNENQMANFQSTLVDCGLGDLGYRGPKFTWHNKRESSEFVKERLDRVLATGGWCAWFLMVVVEVLAALSSDHNPLWIRFQPNNHLSRIAKPFRFEAFWNLDEDCGRVIKDVWDREALSGNPMAVATNCLNSCKQALTFWSKIKFGAGTRKIKDVLRHLERLQRDENPGNLETIREVQLELHKLLEMEDLKWKQHAKRNWYTKGDRKTKFFHAWANQRKRQNFIEKVHYRC